MSKKILIVDDSASIRQMIVFTLKSAGYNVVEAQDGKQALEKTKNEKFDAILTDVNMPNLDGLSLTKEIRTMPNKNQTTPVLILTTESSDTMKLKGREVKATGWIVKPFDPTKLLSVVAQVLK